MRKNPLDEELAHLLDRAIESSYVGPYDRDQVFANRIILGIGSSVVVITDEAGEAIDDMCRKMVGSSLRRPEESGFSRSAALDLLYSVVAMGTRGDRTGALARLKDACSQGPNRYRFVDQVLVGTLPINPLPVGGCDIYSEWPYRDVEPDIKQVWPVGADSCIATSVVAYDEINARRLADDRMDETKAVLALLGRPPEGLGRRYFLVTDDGRPLARAEGGEFFTIGRVTAGGDLFPGYRELSEAASREVRNDWETRVLSSARWHLSACRTTWPSEALIAVMTALEALFVPSGVRKGKGTHVARGVRSVLRNSDRSGKRLQAWIENAYSERSKVAHQGDRYLDDVHLEELLFILRSALHWAVGHLTWHGANQPCRTLEEALAEHIPVKP